MARITLLIALFLLLAGNASAQQATDTPRKGEGISAFLKRNGRTGKAYHKEFLQLNKKRLRGKEELLLGVKYILPPLQEKGNDEGKKGGRKKNIVHEPLFGKKLDDVEIVSDKLKGACFYISSGHGGPDPGAIGRVGRHELHEDEYAYDVALRLARNLMQEGATVRIIIQDKKDGIRDDRYLKNSKRETCMGDPIPLNQVARLKQRSDKINELYAKDRKQFNYCRAIFLHVDSRSKGERIDVFFYHAPQSKQGKRLATGMRNTFQAKYDKHQPNRGFSGTVSERNLYVLRNALPVGTYVELGNLQNTLDQRRFVLADNRQALANWMTEAIISDYRK